MDTPVDRLPVARDPEQLIRGIGLVDDLWGLRRLRARDVEVVDTRRLRNGA